MRESKQKADPSNSASRGASRRKPKARGSARDDNRKEADVAAGLFDFVCIVLQPFFQSS
jgi:hypothetical protein